MPRQLAWQAQERDQSRTDEAHSRARPATSMVRPHRAKVLALDLVQRLDRNDWPGAEGRNHGEPVRPFAGGLTVACAITGWQEPCEPPKTRSRIFLHRALPH